MLNNWNEMLEERFRETTKESFDDIIECTLSKEEMDEDFDAGYGGTEGKPFLAWSKNWVYFPVCYDGAEWVGAVPRNPGDHKPVHWGGG